MSVLVEKRLLERVQTFIGNSQVILLRNVQPLPSEILSGISFSHRERDIVSCILNGRSAKKIAQLLEISHRTVESHLRNIMLKIGCSSQEKIIDFIEQTNIWSPLKEHYKDLLINIAFRLELKKIAVLLDKQDVICKLVHNMEEKEKIFLVQEIQEHLKLAGITTSINNRNKSGKNFPKEGGGGSYVISCYSKNLQDFEVEQFFSELTNENPNCIILPLLCLSPSEINQSQLTDSTIEMGNYYFSIFEILKKLSPSVDLVKNIKEFKEQHKKILSYGDQRELKTFPEQLSRDFGKEIGLNKTIQKKLSRALPISLFFIGCFSILFACYVINQRSEGIEIKGLSSLWGNLRSGTSALQLNAQSMKPIRWNLPRQDYVFIGRKELLEELHSQLNPKQESNKRTQTDRNIQAMNSLVIAACAGLGGIGKTQLALQYIHHTKHPYTLKAWFQAENIDNLKQQYVDFATMLGYKEEKPSIKTALPYIKEWLSAHPDWLIVYDNVNDYKEIEPYLPIEGGKIILTTRQQKWPSAFSVLNVDVMSEEESTELMNSLMARKISETEKQEIKNLVKVLGHLPLALAQAGSYIRQTQITINDYLNLYKSHEQELLADNTLLEGTNSCSVAIVWNISLEAIAKEAKATNQPNLALDLLNACAYLAPEKIPYNLLFTWFKEKYSSVASPELVLPKLISQLWQYSIINKEKNGDITLHRLVQAVVRYRHKRILETRKSDDIPLSLEWYRLLLKSSHAEFSRKTKVLEDELRQKNLLPHLQMLLSHFKEIWPNVSESNLNNILNDVGAVFFLIGEAKIAKSYFERSLFSLEQDYGKQYIEVAYVLDQLGRVYRFLGDSKKAEETHECALKIKEQHYDKNDFKIAYTLDHLGWDYRSLGDAQKAKEAHERALKIKEQYYSKNHIEVAYTLNQLARDYLCLGKDELSKEIHERALVIYEQHYGKNHVEVAVVLDYLARVYKALGNFKQAKELHERALKIKEQHYHQNHVEVASTLNHLAANYRELGNNKLAKELHERVLAIYEQYYGQYNVNISDILDALGKDHVYLGNFHQAKELYERALKIKEEYYGKNHVEIAYTLDRLGEVRGCLGDYKQAEEDFRLALAIYESYYGRDHVKVARILNHSGKIYNKSGEANRAKVSLERAFPILQRYYGSNHTETAEALTNLGSVYVALGNYEQGKISLEQALSIRRSSYGEDHSLVAETLLELGNAYKASGKIKQAQLKLKQALKIRTQYFGEDHLLTEEVKQAIAHLSSSGD